MERDIVKKRQRTLRGSRCQVRGHVDIATRIPFHRSVPRFWRVAQWFLCLGERQTVAVNAGRRAPEGRHRGGACAEPPDVWSATNVAGVDGAGLSGGRDRIVRLRREMALRCKQKRKFQATINSNHDLPVAENLLNQTFRRPARTKPG